MPSRSREIQVIWGCPASSWSAMSTASQIPARLRLAMMRSSQTTIQGSSAAAACMLRWRKWEMEKPHQA